MNRTEYKNQFNANHYERINFSVPKGMKQVIKDLASDKGMSMNKYFLFLVNKDQEGIFDNMQLAEKGTHMMDMMSSSKMEEQFIAGQNWKSENVLHKTTKVLHKTPFRVLLIRY